MNLHFIAKKLHDILAAWPDACKQMPTQFHTQIRYKGGLLLSVCRGLSIPIWGILSLVMRVTAGSVTIC